VVALLTVTWIGVASLGRDARVIFHFQFSGDRGWEAMGSGEGAGDDPLSTAIVDLQSLHGGMLPAGSYQYIQAIGGDARWQGFELGDEGELLIY
jgi:hypothetical protein